METEKKIQEKIIFQFAGIRKGKRDEYWMDSSGKLNPVYAPETFQAWPIYLLEEEQ